MWGKFRSTSKEYANPFYFKEKFKFASKKDENPFYLKKNSDLHLRKMQIRFIWRKIVDYMQIFKIKKQIIPTINKLRTCFYKPNYEYLKQLNTHHYDKKSIKIKGFRKQPLAWTLFYLRGCFRVQRNLFNYLWNLKTLASIEN